jgi:hypothetical protein
VSTLAINPEIMRNLRIHLRPGRMLAVVVICAAISLSVTAFYLHPPTGRPPSPEDARNLLLVVVTFQIVALLIGGGIYCLQSIHREKDLNTFDYQRITRLTPLEVVVGKLFGAPIQMYFSVLCLMPVAVWTAFRGDVPFSSLLKIYVLIILGSIVYHSLALLLSLLMERGTAAGGIVLFLAGVGITSIDFGQGGSPFGIHALSPFFAYSLVPAVSSAQLVYYNEANGAGESPLIDSFLGVHIQHSWVLVVLYLTFVAWFLLASVRNIKRDPLAYEVYSPAQGFTFVLYLSALLLGFFRWTVPQYRYDGAKFWVTYTPIEPYQAELTFLMVCLSFFGLFGLTLLRNRDRIRRRIRVLGAKAAGWWAALWPAPYLIAGSVLAGLGIVSMIRVRLRSHGDWSVASGLLEASFFSLWIVRDSLYLQWMNLRRARRPLMTGVLYLVVFYACASTLFVPFGWYDASGAPYASIFVPLHAFQLANSPWELKVSAWISALILLALEALGFAWLQRRDLQGLWRSVPET